MLHNSNFSALGVHVGTYIVTRRLIYRGALSNLKKGTRCCIHVIIHTCRTYMYMYINVYIYLHQESKVHVSRVRGSHVLAALYKLSHR